MGKTHPPDTCGSLHQAKHTQISDINREFINSIPNIKNTTQIKQYNLKMIY